jgi:hypothetical protein
MSPLEQAPQKVVEVGHGVLVDSGKGAGRGVRLDEPVPGEQRDMDAGSGGDRPREGRQRPEPV